MMNIRFPGHYYDAGTDLHYNWHRYYDPVVGRYLQPETGGVATQLSIPMATRTLMTHFSYARNNPLVVVDPTAFWYVDFNFSISFFTGGVQFNDKGIYPYVGGGIQAGGLPAPTARISFSPDGTPQKGWFHAAQVVLGIGGSAGKTLEDGESFKEFGFGEYDFSFSINYSFDPTGWIENATLYDCVSW